MVLDEIRDWLVAHSVGVYGTSIFNGGKAVLPDVDTPFILLTETGGIAPIHIQNEPQAHVQQPTVQVLTRGKNYAATRAKAKEAYDALVGVSNTLLGTVFYQSIRARQEPTEIGLDEKNRIMISFNIDIKKARS